MSSDSITSEELYAAYMAMCNNKEWGPEPDKRFQRRAAELMLEIHQAIPSNHIHRSDGQQQQARGYMKVVLTSSEMA